MTEVQLSCRGRAETIRGRLFGTDISHVCGGGDCFPRRFECEAFKMSIATLTSGLADETWIQNKSLCCISTQ
jgi:hypothetical protein